MNLIRQSPACRSICFTKSDTETAKNFLALYRVIHKSLRDFRTRLRNNQDRHGRKEHINRERERETLQVSVLPYRCSICAPLVTRQAPDKRFSHTLDSLSRWARTACSFRSAQAATLLEFHVPFTNCFVCSGSVWYMIRNLHCTVTIDSVLANSKTQNAFLFTMNVIFRHDYPLAVEPASTPRPLVQKKTWRDSLPIDMLLSAVSVWVVAQSSSEIPEGLMNNPVYTSERDS